METRTKEQRRESHREDRGEQAGARYVNRLAGEASPYLLQHAHNPVAWWPWCDEALAEAKRRDVPILLSIGYSACHWCHVMERESFEDATTAAVMNELFVNIKVDREERPDLDQVYQLVVQLMGRSGGWPLTVFLTPSQKPFFGGTYYPPEDRYGMPSFAKILHAIAEAYRDKRDDVEDQAAELTRAIADVSRGDASSDAAGPPGPDLLARATERLLARFDAVNGGFGRAPKFPNTMPLELLLRRGVLEGDGKAAEAARLALGAMRRGGIWDHLGGGFHRYSTDERWLVPHFEKMLYDNALLLRAYVDGARAATDPAERDRFVTTARAIAAYVAREMTDAEGGFYASQDADSEGEEGKFFVWDEASVSAALASSTGGPSVGAASPGDAGPTSDVAATAFVLAAYGITPAGNFEDHGRPTFQTVLAEAKPLTALAASFGIGVEAAAARLAAASQRLFEARERRVKPFRDEKILASWSALMISSLAEAGAALDDDTLLAAAEKAFAFLEAKLVSHVADPGEARARVARLAKRIDGGEWLVKGPGFLDDHAFVANAALDLYEATGAPSYVARARAIAAEIVASFASEGDGFFFTPSYAEALIARAKDPYDNAIPSGVSIAARVFLRLGSLVDARFAVRAERELLALAPAAIANPLGFGQSLCELDRLVHGAIDVVLVGARRDPRTIALARTVHARFVPNRTLAWLDPTDPSSREACALLAEGKPAHEAPVAYVCRGRTCSLPVTSPEALAPLLAPLRPSPLAPSASAPSAPPDPKAPR